MGLKSNFYLTALMLAFFLVIGTCKNITASNLSSIPQERLGSNGGYNQNALAQRLTKALKEDRVLFALMSRKDIYVAQSGSKVILKGIAPDKYSMMRIVNIARNLEGVTEIDVSQVKTK